MRQTLNAAMNAEKRLAKEINTAHNNLIGNSLEKELFSFYDRVDENITRVKEIMYRFDIQQDTHKYIMDPIYRLETDSLLWQKMSFDRVADLLSEKNKQFYDKGYGVYNGLEDVIKTERQRNNIRTCEILSRELGYINHIDQNREMIRGKDLPFFEKLQADIKESYHTYYQGTFKSRQSRVNGYSSGIYNDADIQEVYEKFGITVNNAAMARVVLLGGERGLSVETMKLCIEQSHDDPNRVNEYMRAMESFGDIDKIKQIDCPVEQIYIEASILYKAPELGKKLYEHDFSLAELYMIKNAVELEIPAEEIINAIEIDKETNFADLSKLQEKIEEYSIEEQDLDYEAILDDDAKIDYEQININNEEKDEQEESRDDPGDVYESIIENGLRGGTAAAAVSMFGQFEVQPVKAAVVQPGERQSFSELAAYANNLNNQQRMERIVDMIDDVPNGSDFMIKDDHGCDYIHVQRDVNGNVSISTPDDGCKIDRETFREMCSRYPDDCYRQVVGRTERYRETKERNERERYEPTRERGAKQDN